MTILWVSLSRRGAVSCALNMMIAGWATGPDAPYPCPCRYQTKCIQEVSLKIISKIYFLTTCPSATGYRQSSELPQIAASICYGMSAQIALGLFRLFRRGQYHRMCVVFRLYL